MKAQTIILGNVIFMKKLLYPFAAIVFAMLPALSCNKESAVKVVDLAKLTADYEAKDGETLSGILGGNYKITIADGAVVTLKNAVIYGENNEAYKWAGITATGDATIVLVASNIVRGFHENYPGIFVPEGKTLRIKGNGKLEAGSSGRGAGIGGANYEQINCGNIEILEGTIRAVSGMNSAAIGAGGLSECGSITISGGFVTAVPYNSDSAAGIGTGRKRSRCGDITISGGNVVAEAGDLSAGIGSSYESICGNITISGGTVTAHGGTNAACIGSGAGCDKKLETSFDPSVCGNITISGGTVTAEAAGDGNTFAAGIGSGNDNAVCGNILISGGTVYTKGGSDAAGIGTSEQSSVGDITITDGVTKVTAEKTSMGEDTHCIGGGTDYKRIGKVTISAKSPSAEKRAPSSKARLCTNRENKGNEDCRFGLVKDKKCHL